ncbi:hypothetical protein JQ557_34890 [Bradyrhizobium sp. U87765 SZCCT0131]|uniref:hypothetical protein n=1 Tax=unclassified Bradyrhizobium TaxID=2631580 RepID=UPI001BAADEAC|nr:MULTISPECIES: hypothetical protein [unclassified Bradyrhizobium]MBR1223230.1 hypothetical protein [Bradyrhizobium sp. U87765 SZCCT0131]MBR1265800.1 hypothetical protein [Bradyrhizobium sp. U87765 SZCCT0134]MBR1309229.1 hypothetical protein [Bradyrhizobium sp. U87765 SZCCT0110]MBR1323192.1 hypothetical protein [Bradyrhizobium sp. U87765 SZCCT0109]MBR1352455.1 hypothetical protein [Bradyrhizobium sp. U87765 SZCCT0048]
MTRIAALIRRFLVDDSAGGSFNYLLASSLVSLLALGTVYEARLAVADKFEALASALQKQGMPYR